MEGVIRAAEETEERIKAHMPPRDLLKINIGPSWVTSNVETRWHNWHPVGLEVQFEYRHTWRSGFGLGIDADLFEFTYDLSRDGVGGSNTQWFFGPSLTWGRKFSKRWIFDWSIGMGLAYVDDVGNNQFGFGTQVKIGIDYMLNDHVGVGLELNSLNSFFKKPEKVKIRDNERYGFSRLGLMAGVRYYF